jgi:hypothetical protein
MLSRLFISVSTICLFTLSSLSQAALIERNFNVRVTSVSGFSDVSVGDVLPFSYTFESSTPEDSLTTSDSTFSLYTGAVLEMNLGTFDPVTTDPDSLILPENFISVTDGQPNRATPPAYQDSYGVVIRNNDPLSDSMSFGMVNGSADDTDDLIVGTSILSEPTDWYRDVVGDAQVSYESNGSLLVAELTPVPLPASIYLFLSALGLLLPFGKRLRR